VSKARDSVRNTFLTTALLCVICSVLVSASAVGLKSRQDLNKQLDKKKNILAVCEIDSSNGDVQRLFEENIEARLVDLHTGLYVKQTPDSKQTAASFDLSKLTESEFKTLKDDPAGLGGRREQFEVIYVFEKGNQLVLPIRGKGLWSTLWGFLSIDAKDFTTRGITFYSHAETPGLGGEVDSDAFKSQWMEENATLDADGKVIIEVAKAGQAVEGEIDGLAGATITTQGVDKLIKYWLGPDGFGPFLVGNGSKFGAVAQN
tara:strand:+ start:1621 stop:2400 length:780 start_codon:yes stop_codon:yes gene_type:complete